MNHHQLHWLEKFQVQLAAIAAVVAVYMLAWPALRPADPLRALTFFAGPGPGSMVTFALAVWCVAAFCAVVTVTSRPEGAVLATALGIGGLSLRSSQMRSLIWAAHGHQAAMLGGLAAESLMLAGIAASAAVVIVLVRAAMAAVNPRLTWKDPATSQAHTASELLRSFFWPLPPLWRFVTRKNAENYRQHAAASAMRQTLRSACCAVLGTLIAVMLLALLTGSSARGQIIFAQVVAFTIGMIIAQQIVPARWSLVVWMIPSLTAALMYRVAWMTLPQSPGADWTSLPLQTRALPIDWFAAGGGGALLGYWISARLRHLRHMEDQELRAEN